MRLIYVLSAKMDVTINRNFLAMFTPNEQLVMLQLLLNADEYGMVEFSDRRISKSTGISHQCVRTIHQKFIRDKVVINTASNTVANTRRNFVTICRCDSYKGFKRFANTVTNTVTNTDGFEKIWDMYSKKKGRTKELVRKWNNLSDNDKEAIFKYVPAYVALVEENYRQQFSTFLSQRTWENEKIYTHNIAVPYGSFNPKLVEDPTLFPSFVERYNEKIRNSGLIAVDMVNGLTEKRRVLFNIAYCLHFYQIKEVIDKAKKNPRLNGSNGFSADFDYIFEPNNFLRIYEGK